MNGEIEALALSTAAACSLKSAANRRARNDFYYYAASSSTSASHDNRGKMDPPGNNDDRNNDDRGNEFKNDFIEDNDHEAFVAEANLVDEHEQEHFRLMAIVEANVRVQDNTGFDRAEYDRQQRLSQQNNPRIRPRPIHFFLASLPVPKPTLPDPPRLQNLPQPSLLRDSISSSTSSARTSSVSTARPQEASLPPRRANRRYNEHPRGTSVPELCDGVVVQLPDGTTVDDIIMEEKIENSDGAGRPRPLPSVTADPYHIIVECLGCGCRLRAHRLAAMVNCSRCLTVSPSFPPEEGRRK